MLARGDRQPFVTGGQWSASVDEKAGAYASMMSYSGRYEVEGSVVRHHVTLSLFPNWAGGVQSRQIERFADDELVLIARLENSTPEARTSRLVWKRGGAAKQGSHA
jgi:hypothetical protein